MVSSRKIFLGGVLLLSLLMVTPLFAHHILGRPSYSLNEDSNTPPSMQAELQAGSYDVLYMAYPAFPKANERGRINIHASHIVTGKTYVGEMTFRVKHASWFSTEWLPDEWLSEEWFPAEWFSSESVLLGVQKIDDGVFRQGFVFKEDGEYTILAEFSEGEHTHIMNFPLRVGAPALISPAGYAVIFVIIILLAASIANRKKLERQRIKRHHSESDSHNVINNNADA
jgi:hypothetical protein